MFLFFHWNLVDTLLMTTAFKFRREEFIHNLASHFFVDKTTRHYENVGIVVLSDEMSNLRNPTKSCTNALMLVERHVNAFTTTANGNTRKKN